MNKLYFLILSFLLLYSCSTRNQIVYINDSNTNLVNIVDTSTLKNYIEIGDILKIDVQTIVPEASFPYNSDGLGQLSGTNLDILKLEGYLVNDFKIINFPVLGDISVESLTIYQLEKLISSLLVKGGHLTNPSVKIRRVNSKFTILGEVSKPGTFSYIDENLNIFQALGYAGDLTIDGKRNKINLIREKSGLRAVYKISLSESDLLSKPYYQIKNNDIIIVEPNFSKVKSAGFIGSPSTIASLASLLLSITLLILNK